MNCCNGRKNNCGVKTPAICVYYYGYLPEYSDLDKDCVVLEETTEELYRNQEEILDSLDLSELGNDCIEYQQQSSKLKAKEVLYAFESEICDIKDKLSVNVFQEMILDFKSLTDPCGNDIANLKTFFQTLIDEIDKLK